MRSGVILRLKTMLGLVLVTGLGAMRARAQAAPTAYATIRLQAFGGVTGNYTGVALAKNLGVMAGFDLGFKPFKGFYPAIEGRGLYPVDKGNTVNEENLLAGLRLGRNKDRFNPYGDLLFGRGRLTFPGGYPNAAQTFLVESNTTNVFSFGGGLDYMLTPRFGVRGDFQMQRYESVVSPTGSLYSKDFSAALVYRFGSGKIR